tara:strand:+ start:689 stop:1288 length:600 start_codon:yes stop_codon:yes gene_type:complete
MDNKEVFQTLNELNVNEFTQKKGNFTYLSWAWAVRELLKVAPNATWQIHKFPVSPEDNGERQPYMKTDTGYFVQVTVDVGGVMRTQIHPVLDNRNQTIDEPNAFQINTSIQRCLAKAIALHGLGLYIYAGEDLPTDDPLTSDEINEITKLAKNVGKAKSNGIQQMISDGSINRTNYAASVAKLERLQSEKEKKVETSTK